jgi:hypothetical protein
MKLHFGYMMGTGIISNEIRPTSRLCAMVQRVDGNYATRLRADGLGAGNNSNFAEVTTWRT